MQRRDRRSRCPLASSLLAALWLGCSPGSATDEATVDGARLEPGRWEFTTTSSVPGMKTPKKRTTSKCIPPDQTDPVEHLRAEQKCELTQRDEAGRTVRWKMTCPTVGHAWLAEGEITSHGSHAEGQMDMKMSAPEREFLMNLEWKARRVGDC